MRIIFMGTPDFAVPTLGEIISAGHEVVCVYTQPPRQAGRGMAERPSPVQVCAEQFAIPVLAPTSLKDADVQAVFAAHDADVAVVVAYGLILPQAVLAAPHFGCLNLHASLLPRWRGAAPIQRAIMAGDDATGVAVMRMEAGLDTGPVCVSERMAIGPDMTAGELHDALASTGASLMTRALAALGREALDCTSQPEDGVTYAAKIEKSEARIDWTAPAAQVHDHIRGLCPFPGAWFELEQGTDKARIKVLASGLVTASGSPGEVLDEELTIACGSGAVRLKRVQRAGKGPLSAAEFLRGAQIKPGTKLA
jgi:methionyl-tRNA formyltransferase